MGTGVSVSADGIGAGADCAAGGGTEPSPCEEDLHTGADVDGGRLA